MMENDQDLTDVHREDEARKAEIIERRRQTRRENLERERLEDERLAQETQGGRHAKHLAQANAVWKPERTPASKKDKPVEKNPRKLDKEGGKSKLLSSKASGANERRQIEKTSRARGGEDDRPNQKKRVKNTKARNNLNHLDDQEHLAKKGVKNPRKANTKRAQSKASVESEDDDDDDNDTASSSAEGDFDPDDAGSDEDDGEDDEEVDEEFESPRFTESLKSAHDLFDDDDDIDLVNHRRSSSQSGTLPPTTDDDDNFDCVSAKSRYSSGIDNNEDRPRKRTRTGSSTSSCPIDDNQPWLWISDLK